MGTRLDRKVFSETPIGQSFNVHVCLNVSLRLRLCLPYLIVNEILVNVYKKYVEYNSRALFFEFICARLFKMQEIGYRETHLCGGRLFLKCLSRFSEIPMRSNFDF